MITSGKRKIRNLKKEIDNVFKMRVGDLTVYELKVLFVYFGLMKENQELMIKMVPDVKPKKQIRKIQTPPYKSDIPKKDLIKAVKSVTARKENNAKAKTKKKHKKL